MSTGLALRIVAGEIERLPDSPVNDLAWLQKQVDGYIEIALTDNMGGNERIVVWCNEEGHLRHLEPNVHRCTDGWMLVGPLIVTGCTPNGDNRGLTEEEAARVRVVAGDWAKGEGTGKPVLEILP